MSRSLNQNDGPSERTETNPPWARRLPKRKIAELYSADAKGIIDKDLINDVGYGLLARCKSILTATEASRGRAACPGCDQIIAHSHGREEILLCSGCQWRMSWAAYKKSYQHKQLHAGGMEPFFKEYVSKFSKARTSREKMILIDTLIHRYHWEMTEKISRSGAVNLISGTLMDVIAFLDELTYSENSTPEIRDNLAAWREKQNRAYVKWWYRRTK